METLFDIAGGREGPHHFVGLSLAAVPDQDPEADPESEPEAEPGQEAEPAIDVDCD